MFLGEILFALVMALLFTSIFTAGFKRPGPWAAWWAFFLVLFLSSWAGGLWISPAGPVFVGVYWLPVVLISFVVALFLAGTTPPKRGHGVETISQVKKEDLAVEKAFDFFFWVLLVSLIIVIVLGYLVPHQEIIAI